MDEHSLPDDDFRARIRRILNEYKRQELAEKYSVQFSLNYNSNLSPEVGAQWLDNIDEFEHQFENTTKIPLRDFVGSPPTRSLADIPPSDLEAEVEHLLDILADHDVFVDFLHKVETQEAYRFIVEELLDEAIDNMRIPGMQRHFIYEEFHPNDEEDIGLWDSR